MKTEIKETRKANGIKVYTLFIDNKIIAECTDINKLIALKQIKIN